MGKYTVNDAGNKVIEDQLPSPLPGVRAGSVALTAVDVTKAVVFGAPMDDADYVVMLMPQVNLSVGSLTTLGFTITISVALNGTVNYIAARRG